MYIYVFHATTAWIDAVVLSNSSSKRASLIELERVWAKLSELGQILASLCEIRRVRASWSEFDRV